MSATNKTAYYELPQFVDNDIFNPLVDDNDAYSKIDTALHNIADAEADDASEIVGIKSRLDGAEGDIDALEAQNGNSVLTTTAQTLSGAVNELDADSSELDGRLDIVEDDINNVTTGIKAKLEADELRIGTLETQNGNSVLTTIAQTLSGAINELDDDITTAKYYVTPEEYGAAGDGDADDTAAFAAAIADGRPVYACKTYKLSETIKIIGSSFETRNILINKVVSSANVAFVLCGENIDFDIRFISCPSGVGIQLGDGVEYGLAISNVKFGYVGASICIKSLPCSDYNVQDVNIDGNVCVYTTNGMLIDGTNRWTGEINIHNVWFRTYDGTGGYAIKADCSAHGVTGMNLYGVSFEGANGGIEALETDTLGQNKEFAPINAYGLRVSEMSLNEHQNVIRKTGDGRIFGEIFVDIVDINSFNIAAPSATASRQSPLTIHGKIIKGSNTYDKAILVSNELAVDVENGKCEIIDAVSLDDDSLPASLSRVNADLAVTLRKPFIGTLNFMVHNNGTTVTINGTGITVAEDDALVTVDCFYIVNVGYRYLVTYKDMHKLILPAAVTP